MNAQPLAVALTFVNLVLLTAAYTQDRPTAEQGVAPLVRAHALELVDGRGQLRARLNVEPGGEVVFRLLDQEGTIRVKLGAAKDGSGLLLANDATEPGVHILAKATGSSLRLANKDGREQVIQP
jgi:hypothetical protein